MLKDDDPTIVNAMLQYMYTGNYGDEDKDAPQAFGLFSVSVYALADKYDVPKLGSLVAAKLNHWAGDHWMETSFTEVVREIYTNAVDRKHELQHAVVSVAVRNSQSLFLYRRHAEFREVAATLPGFTMALASDMATERVDSPISLPSEVSEVARQFYLCMKTTAYMRGVSVKAQRIATITGLGLEEVSAAAKELENECHIHSTGEGDEWALGRRQTSQDLESGNGWGGWG